MTVVVGYLSGKGGKGALHLAVESARVLETSLTVTTVVPKPWTTLSKAKIDAEYAQWAQKLSDDSKSEATAYLEKIGAGIDVTFHNVAHRSVSGGLLEAVEASDADVLVVGSASEGRLGQVVLGSTGDRLLHSSPVPLAISPRGYRGSRAGTVSRVTCGYPGTEDAVDVVQQAVRLTQRLHAPLRVVTFAGVGAPCSPPVSAPRPRTQCSQAGSPSPRKHCRNCAKPALSRPMWS
ncbi:Universal stress protein [Mycobacteroides abscessus]|nr:Universal stress protein [Mycobacteroides abscessus]